MSKRDDFTPGPWEWDGPIWNYDRNEEVPWLIQSGAATGVILTGEIECRRESDARLIAAAPDLLEALELARVELECLGGELSRLNGEPPSMVCALMDPEVINRVDAAIAKAKGADHERN